MGRLSCNTSVLEPKALLHPLKLRCEDGTNVDIAVTTYSDGHISFVGRLAA